MFHVEHKCLKINNIPIYKQANGGGIPLAPSEATAKICTAVQ